MRIDQQVVLAGVMGLCACVSSPSEPPPGVISGIWAPPLSLEAKGEEVRSRGGVVLLMRTVSIGDLELSDPTPVGVPGVFQRVQRRTFRVEVLDSLGEAQPAGSAFDVVGIVGPVVLTDAAGEPRMDWVVSGAAPLTSRAPHQDTNWVLFGYPTDSHVLILDFAASEEDGIVDGADTSGDSVALDVLRRPSP